MTHSTSEYNKTGFQQLIQKNYPQVESFEIRWDTHSVVGVDYTDSHYRKRMEYPPVAVWWVNGSKFTYVLHPEFKVERWNSLFFSRTETKVDYSSQEDVLLQCIQWSIDGVSVEEVNKRLEIINNKNSEVHNA